MLLCGIARSFYHYFSSSFILIFVNLIVLMSLSESPSEASCSTEALVHSDFLQFTESP